MFMMWLNIPKIHRFSEPGLKIKVIKFVYLLYMYAVGTEVLLKTKYYNFRMLPDFGYLIKTNICLW